MYGWFMTWKGTSHDGTNRIDDHACRCSGLLPATSLWIRPKSYVWSDPGPDPDPVAVPLEVAVSRIPSAARKSCSGRYAVRIATHMPYRRRRVRWARAVAGALRGPSAAVVRFEMVRYRAYVRSIWAS